MRQISRYLRIVLAAQLILAFAAFPVCAQDTKEDAESYSFDSCSSKAFRW